ncbi:MAG: hypothetical protein JNM18_15240 [Planctomycetaceae bacterium]|nr:hypothetical protein [Planctomycetaceae bacterium]
MDTAADEKAVVASTSRVRFAADDSFVAYRPLNRLAIASFVLGLASLVAFFDTTLAIVPALGMATGLLGWMRIRSEPDAYAGGQLALLGMALSVVCWAGGWSWLSYVYMTEVPGGAQRITYDELQPDPDSGDEVPAFAKEIDGQRVFIKGFMYPGAQSRGINEFILCYSNDDCCFGGNPKLTHMIHVTLKPPLVVNFATRQHKIAGTFKLAPSGPVDGLSGAIYNIEADYVK